MLIRCPKCQTVYEVDDEVVTASGVKMHCQNCNETFKAYPEDAVKEQPKVQNLNISKMFERIHDETLPFFDERPQKIRVVHLTHYKNHINYFLILMMLVLLVAMLYFMRYEVVRYVPKAEIFYEKLGVESVYEGKNLEIQDLQTDEKIIKNISKIRIKGNIYNDSEYNVSIPPLKVVVYNLKGETLLDTTHYLQAERLAARQKFSFEIMVTNPTPFDKNIHITFEN